MLAMCVALSLGTLSSLEHVIDQGGIVGIITSTRNRKVPGSTPSQAQLMSRDTAKQAYPYRCEYVNNIKTNIQNNPKEYLRMS